MNEVRSSGLITNKNLISLYALDTSIVKYRTLTESLLCGKQWIDSEETKVNETGLGMKWRL